MELLNYKQENHIFIRISTELNNYFQTPAAIIIEQAYT